MGLRRSTRIKKRPQRYENYRLTGEKQSWHIKEGTAYKHQARIDVEENHRKAGERIVKKQHVKRAITRKSKSKPKKKPVDKKPVKTKKSVSKSESSKIKTETEPLRDYVAEEDKRSTGFHFRQSPKMKVGINPRVP